MKISYDYEDLIEELKALDLADDTKLYLVRKEKAIEGLYKPIIDFDTVPIDALSGEYVAESTVGDAMREMIELNRII